MVELNGLIHLLTRVVLTSLLLEWLIHPLTRVVLTSLPLEWLIHPLTQVVLTSLPQFMCPSPSHPAGALADCRKRGTHSQEATGRSTKAHEITRTGSFFSCCFV